MALTHCMLQLWFDLCFDKYSTRILQWRRQNCGIKPTRTLRGRQGIEAIIRAQVFWRVDSEKKFSCSQISYLLPAFWAHANSRHYDHHHLPFPRNICSATALSLLDEGQERDGDMFSRWRQGIDKHIVAQCQSGRKADMGQGDHAEFEVWIRVEIISMQQHYTSYRFHPWDS